MTVNPYEVTLKLVNKNTRAVTSDVMMQAIFNQSAEIETGSADITVTHVGPPQKLIQEAERSMEDAISRLAREPRCARRWA